VGSVCGGGVAGSEASATRFSRCLAAPACLDCLGAAITSADEDPLVACVLWLSAVRGREGALEAAPEPLRRFVVPTLAAVLLLLPPARAKKSFTLLNVDLSSKFVVMLFRPVLDACA